MIKLRVLSAAARDLAQAVEYYEAQSQGLGMDFLDEYEKTVSRICKFPEAWTQVSSSLRRCLMRRFPYAVFYSRKEAEIIIAAVANLRMDPAKLPR